MRAFLSYSSLDAHFVSAVAENLRHGSYDQDCSTFDLGALSSSAIVAALKRCSLYCLFLSAHSIASRPVQFESDLALEISMTNDLRSILIFCLDSESFSKATSNQRLFNISTKLLSPEAVAKTIQSKLLAIAAENGELNNPFVGREAELREINQQLSDIGRPNSKAIYISGVYGSGRRTIARKIYSNHFPHVNQVFFTLEIDNYFGIDDLYVGLLKSLRKSMRRRELHARITEYELATKDKKIEQIVNLIQSASEMRCFICLIDQGGLLDASSNFSIEIQNVLEKINDYKHPALVFISSRMIRTAIRNVYADISFCRLTSLDWDSSLRLISLLLKRRQISVSAADIEQLTYLMNGHPINAYRITEEVAQYGAVLFLNNQSNFIEWSRREFSSYVKRMSLSAIQVKILSLLTYLPELDLIELSNVLDATSDNISADIQDLLLHHILETDSDLFLISPALRIAVEHDARIRATRNELRSSISTIAKSLSLRFEEDVVPISLVNSATLASIELEQTPGTFISAFLLPSHFARVAKQRYDQRSWEDSLRFGRRAIEGAARLSHRAQITVCRYLCLSAARLGKDDVFNEALDILKTKVDDDWGRSNIEYLQGFRLRLKGELPAAKAFLVRARGFDVNNRSAVRELAAIAVESGDLKTAEDLARIVYSSVPTNPYFIDILLRVLIEKRSRTAADTVEIDSLLSSLKQVGEHDGRSFYTMRRADYALRCGAFSEALSHIRIAVSKTPSIFEVRRIEALIHLEIENIPAANNAIEAMYRILSSNSEDDNQYRYSSYLRAKAQYCVLTRDFSTAREIYALDRFFDADERARMVRIIDFEASR